METLSKAAVELLPSQVDLLMVDLVFTVLVPVNGESKRRMIARLYRYFGFEMEQPELGRIPDTISDDTIIRTVNAYRTITRSWPEDEKRWHMVNVGCYDDWLPKDDPRRSDMSVHAKRVHASIVGGDHYRVQEVMKRVLQLARRNKVRVVLVSNALRRNIEIQLARHEITDLFDAVYCDQDLGFRKPDHRVWQKVLEAESKVAGREIRPEETVHIGNSANTDVGAASLGIRVMLINRMDELAGIAHGLREMDVTKLDIPEQPAEELIQLLQSGLISVHSGVGSIYEWLKAALDISIDSDGN